MSDTYVIRPEQSEDYPAIQTVIRAAFAEIPYSDQTEYQLVERLRQSPAYVPDLALVALALDRVIGHILLTEVSIVAAAARHMALALAPVSVHPDWQGRGIGARLIEAAHTRARQLGYDYVVLLGHAAYYPRFGYRPAHEFDIRFPFAAPPENCMALELVPDALRDVRGEVVYPAAFFT